MSIILRRWCSTPATKPRTLVELFYDIISPYTYIQFELLNRQLTRGGWHSMRLTYTPVFISGLIVSTGNTPPVAVPTKAAYIIKDVERLGSYHKIPILQTQSNVEMARNFKSLKLQRFLASIYESISVEEHARLIRAHFENFFSPHERLDISGEDVIRKISIEAAGLEPSIVDKGIEAIGRAATKQLLKDTTARAVQVGGFGLPLTLVHLPSGPELVFGCDRMYIIGRLLGEQHPPILN